LRRNSKEIDDLIEDVDKVRLVFRLDLEGERNVRSMLGLAKTKIMLPRVAK